MKFQRSIIDEKPWESQKNKTSPRNSNVREHAQIKRKSKRQENEDAPPKQQKGQIKKYKKKKKGLKDTMSQVNDSDPKSLKP